MNITRIISIGSCKSCPFCHDFSDTNGYWKCWLDERKITHCDLELMPKNCQLHNNRVLVHNELMSNGMIKSEDITGIHFKENDTTVRDLILNENKKLASKQLK